MAENALKVSQERAAVSVENCFGRVVFSQAQVPPLSHILANVLIEKGSVTVYSEPAKTPVRGQLLNVPALITLKQLFSLSEAQQETIKTVGEVRSRQFVAYNAALGEWTFKVKHFTRYGLEEDSEGEEAVQSLTSPTVPEPQRPRSAFQELSPIISIESDAKRFKTASYVEPQPQKPEPVQATRVPEVTFDKDFRISLDRKGNYYLPEGQGLVKRSMQMRPDTTAQFLGRLSEAELIRGDNFPPVLQPDNFVTFCQFVAKDSWAHYWQKRDNKEQAQLWTLFSAVFAEPSCLPFVQTSSVKQGGSRDSLISKAIQQWIVSWGSLVKSSPDPLETIFQYLTINDTTAAAALAISSRNFSLATIIDQHSSMQTELLRLCIESEESSPPNLIKIYRLLSGDVEVLANLPRWQQLCSYLSYCSSSHQDLSSGLLHYFSKFPAQSGFFELLLLAYADFDSFIQSPHVFTLLDTIKESQGVGSAWLLAFLLLSLAMKRKSTAESLQSHFIEEQLGRSVKNFAYHYAETLLQRGQFSQARLALDCSDVPQTTMKHVLALYADEIGSETNKEDSECVEAQALYFHYQMNYVEAFKLYAEAHRTELSLQLLLNEVVPDLVLLYPGSIYSGKADADDQYWAFPGPHRSASAFKPQKLSQRLSELLEYVKDPDVFYQSKFDTISEYCQVIAQGPDSSDLQDLFERLADLPSKTLKQKAAVGIMQQTVAQLALVARKQIDLRRSNLMSSEAKVRLATASAYEALGDY
jgi:hypothetical protein